MRKPGNPRRVRVEVTASEAASLKRKRLHNALFNKGLDAAIRCVRSEVTARKEDLLAVGPLLAVEASLLKLRRDA
jgi:hypothetical protein